MRKSAMMILAAGLLFMGLTHLAAAYNRTVVVENFTNWG